MRTLRLYDGTGQPYAPRGVDRRMHEEWTAMLSLLALGSLDAEEQHSIDRHIASGCDRCPDALKAYAGVAAALGGVFPSVRPSALRTRRVKQMIRRAPAPA